MRPMILLKNAEVFAPERLGRQDVLVAGGQVVALAPQLDVPPGWQVEVLDLQGQMLIPGLLDGHTHLTGGGGEAGAATRVPAVQLTHLTLAGVTTAIGLLGTDARTRTIAELLACARGLSALGFNALCYTGSYEVPPTTLTGSVRGDIVHIDRIIACGEVALSDHRSSQPTFDELVKLAADCHVAGMMTGKAGLLHLHMGDGKRGLSLVNRALDETELPARTFHPTHVNRQKWLWQDAKALAQRGCTVDVTAFPADDESLSAGQAIADWLDSGLPRERLTVSSDGGGCLPTFDGDGVLLHMDVGRSAAILEELRGLVRDGRAWEDVLPFATRNVARLFRLAAKGHVAVGADADLVVLDANAHVAHVIIGGRWFVRDKVAVRRGLFEPCDTF